MQNTAVLPARRSLVFPAIICILASLFYLYEFTLQVSPGVMTNELMRDLHLSAAGLGTMAAFYYYAYTPMQLPAGLLYDRFGPRRLITIAILICALGALFFSMTHGAALASLGRFLMGVGSAFSFIGVLLLVARWFPPQYFALITGIVQLMSSVGAIAGEAPLAAAISTWGWRSTIAWIAIAGIILACLVYLIVRDGPLELLQEHHATPHNEFKRLRAVGTNRETWLIALYTFSSWAPIVAFALWGVPFLVEAYGLSTSTASLACSMMWIGIGIGGPILGWWSDYIGKRCTPLTFCAVLGFIAIAFVIYFSQLPLFLVFALMLAFGVASSSISVSFAVVKDNNHPSQVGTAIGLNNMACVAGGALFQPLIGILLSWHAAGCVQNGVPVYTLVDYKIALAVVPLCYLISIFVSSFLLKETHCQYRFK